MNKSVRMLMAGVVIAALSAGAHARCGGGDYGYGPGFGMHGGHWGMYPQHMQQMHEQHMAVLHDKLKLTAKQEAAWKKFVATAPMLDRTTRPDPAEMAKLSAPKRMEKALEHMRAMEGRMAEHLTALEEFYVVLTPVQQKTFDDYMPGYGPRWNKGGPK